MFYLCRAALESLALPSSGPGLDHRTAPESQLGPFAD
jgi:hypothetical protein